MPILDCQRKYSKYQARCPHERYSRNVLQSFVIHRTRTDSLQISLDAVSRIHRADFERPRTPAPLRERDITRKAIRSLGNSPSQRGKIVCGHRSVKQTHFIQAAISLHAEQEIEVVGANGDAGRRYCVALACGPIRVASVISTLISAVLLNLPGRWQRFHWVRSQIRFRSSFCVSMESVRGIPVTQR